MADSAVALLATQALFLGYWYSSGTGSGTAALLLIFAASHFRLLALNTYTALNGVRRVGIDKAILFITSSGTAVCTVWLARHDASTTQLAAVLAGFAVLQCLLAAGALRNLASGPRSPNWVTPIARKLAGLVMLSQVGGFLNLGTEIPVAKLMLGSDQLADFALSSRAFQAPLAIVALWCQISTPFWATGNMQSVRQLCVMLGRPAIALAALYTVLGLVVTAAGDGFATATGMHTRLPEAFGWMLLNYTMAGTVILIGSYLVATGTTRHLLWASATGALAPLAAYVWGDLAGPSHFYFGYVQTNLLLLILHLMMLSHLTRFAISTEHLRRP